MDRVSISDVHAKPSLVEDLTPTLAASSSDDDFGLIVPCCCWDRVLWAYVNSIRSNSNNLDRCWGIYVSSRVVNCSSV